MKRLKKLWKLLRTDVRCVVGIHSQWDRRWTAAVGGRNVCTCGRCGKVIFEDAVSLARARRDHRALTATRHRFSGKY